MHDVGAISTVSGDVHYLVMEYIAGETLAARLGQGPLSADVLTLWTRQIAEALAAAHARDIVHRDIKPANILILSELLERAPRGTARASQLFDMHLALGEQKTALEWLTRAVDAHDPMIGFSIRSPWTRTIASDPTFAALKQRVFG